MFGFIKNIFKTDNNKKEKENIKKDDDYALKELNRIGNIKDETTIPKNYMNEIEKILAQTMFEFEKENKDYELLIQYESLLIKLRRQIQDRIKQFEKEKENKRTVYKIDKAIKELDKLQKKVRDVVSYMSKELHSYQIKQTEEKNKDRDFWEVNI